MISFFQIPSGGVCGVVAEQHDTFVVHWGPNNEPAGNDNLPQIKPKLTPKPASLRRFDPTTARKLADIKLMEAALRRKELKAAEAKRLAEKHEKVESVKIAKRTRRITDLVNDLELL